MTAYLVDTSVLARLANIADVHHPLAVRAIVTLHRRGDTLHVAPQNLVEFWSVATRPAEANGLGLTPHATEARILGFESAFPLLNESGGVFPLWKQIVGSLGVVGKQVHDARLVAMCHLHGVTHVLTFNRAHFARLAEFGQGIAVVSPDDF